MPAIPDLSTSPDEIKIASDFTEHLVIFRFNNGWTIQKVEKDIDLESDFIKIDARPEAKYDEHLYSLRNEHNVPRANFVASVSEKEPTFFGIREVNYQFVKDQKANNEAYSNALLKEFFDYLKSIGIKPRWTEEMPDSDSVGIRDLKLYIVDDMGIPPFVRGRKDATRDVMENGKKVRKEHYKESFQFGADSDSYYELLKQAYFEAVDGSYYSYSTRVANELIDDIFAFATAREQIPLLDKAVEHIGDWASDEWMEADWGSETPTEPDEPDKEDFISEYVETPGQKEFKNKDFDKTKNKVFDEKGYKEAVEEYKQLYKEYEEKQTALEEYFEPYQFSNSAYTKLQALKPKLPAPPQKAKSKPTKK